MKLAKIQEGKINLFVPEGEALTKKMSAFYNPEMEFDRDLSESLVSILQPKKICDCMCASGVRGLRYKSFLPDSQVILNDINEKAIELARKNAQENNLEARFENQSLLKVLIGERFDFIDIDPFGSPIYFLDAASKSIKNNGYVAITATDTAALCGTSPNAALRKYGIRSARTDFSKELGLRILLSAAMKIFSREELSYTPIFSYSRRHYFRIIGQVKRGAQRTDALLEKFEHISYCRKCGYREYGIIKECKICKGKAQIIEPIFTGDFASPEICKRMIEKLKGKQAEFVKRISEEQGFPLYFDVHKICEWNHKKIRSTEKLLKELDGVRTHFLGTGIKTKKDFGEVMGIL